MGYLMTVFKIPFPKDLKTKTKYMHPFTPQKIKFLYDVFKFPRKIISWLEGDGDLLHFLPSFLL